MWDVTVIVFRGHILHNSDLTLPIIILLSDIVLVSLKSPLKYDNSFEDKFSSH